eukprot:TRINITY_DN2659_c0_g1_i2.p1 TRINITY_DN2659_c0_g1~~TRINITY_DN2659_c0_g1_i2.p1  ORF type:complete len:202 (+),score=15.59 TRINITY_DN2659_c0_g1_i2:113-718(+)
MLRAGGFGRVSQLFSVTHLGCRNARRGMADADLLRGYTVEANAILVNDRRKPNLIDIAWIVKSNALQRLGRSPEGQKVYEEHKAHVASVWRSIDDFILHKIFHCYYTIDLKTNKRIVDLREVREMPDKIVFTLNDFPYDRESDIEQHVIWSTRQLSQDKIQVCLDEYRPSDIWDYVWFENPPSLKSVKTIHHAHVFSKKKN